MSSLDGKAYVNVFVIIVVLILVLSVRRRTGHCAFLDAFIDHVHRPAQMMTPRHGIGHLLRGPNQLGQLRVLRLELVAELANAVLAPARASSAMHAAHERSMQRAHQRLRPLRLERSQQTRGISEKP